MAAMAFNSYRWIVEHRTPDNGYERVYQFVTRCIPATASINVTAETPDRLFQGYNLTTYSSIPDLEREEPRFFIVSSLDARDRYGTTTPEYYRWVESHAREIFHFDGRSFLRLSVFELNTPAGAATVQSATGADCPDGQPGA